MRSNRYYIKVENGENQGLHHFGNLIAARKALKTIAISHNFDNHGIETNFKGKYGYQAINRDFTPYQGTKPLEVKEQTNNRTHPRFEHIAHNISERAKVSIERARAILAERIRRHSQVNRISNTSRIRRSNMRITPRVGRLE